MVTCFATGEECHYCEGKITSYVLPEITIDLSAIFVSVINKGADAVVSRE